MSNRQRIKSKEKQARKAVERAAQDARVRQMHEQVAQLNAEIDRKRRILQLAGAMIPLPPMMSEARSVALTKLLISKGIIDQLELEVLFKTALNEVIGAVLPDASQIQQAQQPQEPKPDSEVVAEITELEVPD